MPLYYLHLSNAVGTAPDEEGVDLPGVPDARARAIDGIRSIIAEEARGGKIDLLGRIDIANAAGETLLEVEFRDAFDLRLESDLARGTR